jgi:hypothetical protein
MGKESCELLSDEQDITVTASRSVPSPNPPGVKIELCS